MSDSNMESLSGLWLKEGKNGKFMSGSLNDKAIEWIKNNGPVKLMVFKNTYKKEGDKQPDYKLFGLPSDDGGGRRQEAKQEPANNDFWS